MAIIHFLGGKKQLLTIQVSEFVALHHLFCFARVLRRHARSSFSFAVIVLTFLALLVVVFSRFNSGKLQPVNAGIDLLVEI